jgi:hypothetical protein
MVMFKEKQEEEAKDQHITTLNFGSGLRNFERLVRFTMYLFS